MNITKLNDRQYHYQLPDLAAHFEQVVRALAQSAPRTVRLQEAFQDMTDARLLLAAGHTSVITPALITDYQQDEATSRRLRDMIMDTPDDVITLPHADCGMH